MKVLIIHPLKHHVYYSAAGILDSGAEVVAMFGYFDQGDFLDRCVRKTKWKKQIEGYKCDKISDCVKTNKFVKTLFLLSKIAPGLFRKLYFRAFDAWVIRNLKGVDCIHVIQDYNNKVIRVAKAKNIKIVYEQIIAYNEKYYYCDDAAEDALQRENLQTVDYILAPSDFVRDSILRPEHNSCAADKIQLIPYGVEPGKFRYDEKHYALGEELHLLIVASVSRRKGFEYLLEAMSMLQDKPVGLTVIGTPNAEDKDLMNRMTDMDNVDYVGRVPHEYIDTYYRANQVFILPSLAEGSALVTYEALSAGLPCIVTRNAGSVVKNGVDGIVVDIKDATAIIHAIQVLLDNPELVNEMSRNAQRTIAEYSWERYAERIKEFYLDNIL